MTEQIDYDPNTVLEALNNKADRDLNNVTDGTYQVLTTKNITNCITKIPQDIKLELVDGVLTLKAGSKIYAPNGFEEDTKTPKFDEILITTDISISKYNIRSMTGKLILYSNITGKSLGFIYINASFSGTSDPATAATTYYNTTTNIIIQHTANNIQTQVSFPCCIFTVDNGTIISIDQIFNGLGYIGSTIFALPGVEGLIPNGRNADGTLNNTKVVTNSVSILTGSSTGNYIMAIRDTGTVDNWSIAKYDENKNIVYRTDNNQQVMLCFCGNLSRAAGRITSFNPKTSFQAVDRNDKEEIISWGMPDLTAGVNLTSGTTIPVNSLVYVASTRSAGNLARAYLDGEEMFKNEGGASTSDGSGATFLAPENSIYTSSGNFDKQIYYPLKGEI